MTDDEYKDRLALCKSREHDDAKWNLFGDCLECPIHEKYCKRLEELEAQCAALRQALIGCKPLVSAAWKSPDRFYCVAYTEPDGISPHLLEEDHLDFYMLKKELEQALNPNAGAALLKHLEAAEAVCDAVERYLYTGTAETDDALEEALAHAWDDWYAWRKAKGESNQQAHSDTSSKMPQHKQ